MTEAELIQNAEAWRKNPQYDCTAFYDNTPYIEISDYLSARAITDGRHWYFQVKWRSSAFIKKNTLSAAVAECELLEQELQERT